ncbi:MAG: SLC13 family permease, partial [Longimicrobiales bacterium]
MRPAQRLGLVLGFLGFVVLLFLPAPEGMSLEAWRTAAVAALMATWWTTEAIPIPATALLPLPLFPMLGVLDAPNAAAPYANELIFLFMGGFLIAVALERWGLHKRIALNIVHAVGTSPKRLVLGFMVATAFLSMWISNTATTAMMLPVALAVAEMLRPRGTDEQYNFGISLMLGIAYAASIGGLATLIGTPPNAVLAGASDELLGIQLGFVEWMIVGLPITLFFLPLCWFLLTRFIYPSEDLVGDAESVIDDERELLGAMSVGEKRVGIVFVATGLAWLMRSEKALGGITIPGIQTYLPAVRDSTIAMLA